MIGGYTLDLYCDNAKHNDGIHRGGEFPHTFYDEYGKVCRAKARAAGWLISDKQVLCPKCSGKKQNRRHPSPDATRAAG